MQGTDLFLIRYEKDDTTIHLEAFANVMPDKEMCHRSCGPDCEYNFKPCSHVITIVTVFIVILSISFCSGVGYILYLAKLRATEDKILAEEFQEIGHVKDSMRLTMTNNRMDMERASEELEFNTPNMSPVKLKSDRKVKD